MTVFVEDSFDAAHFLPNVPENHKCRNMHGHTYRVRIEVAGEVDAETGWVEDYAAIKARWEQVKHKLDHRVLNDIIYNPTCEHIATFIGVSVDATRVEVRETVNCGCIWQAA